MSGENLYPYTASDYWIVGSLGTWDGAAAAPPGMRF
jgi:hypothetical protein